MNHKHQESEHPEGAGSHAVIDAMSLAVATPSHYSSFCGEYVTSILALQEQCLKNGIGFQFLANSGISAIDAARNMLANRFLQDTNATHMLFVDDDMGFSATELMRMFEWKDSDVIAAMCPRKRLDWERVKRAVLAQPDIDPAILANIAGDYRDMFKLENEAPTMTVGPKPSRVQAIGTGLMMISRKCLLRLIDEGLAPRIDYGDNRAGGAAPEGPCYEFFRSTSANGRAQGEDYYFCSLVRQMGGEVLGCSWIPVSHTGRYTFLGDLPGIAEFGP
jgi:hypothetical protein